MARAQRPLGEKLSVRAQGALTWSCGGGGGGGGRLCLSGGLPLIVDAEREARPGTGELGRAALWPPRPSPSGSDSSLSSAAASPPGPEDSAQHSAGPALPGQADRPASRLHVPRRGRPAPPPHPRPSASRPLGLSAGCTPPPAALSAVGDRAPPPSPHAERPRNRDSGSSRVIPAGLSSVPGLAGPGDQ